jgi:hypothetical protein
VEINHNFMGAFHVVLHQFMLCPIEYTPISNTVMLWVAFDEKKKFMLC